MDARTTSPKKRGAAVLLRTLRYDHTVPGRRDDDRRRRAGDAEPLLHVDEDMPPTLPSTTTQVGSGIDVGFRGPEVGLLEFRGAENTSQRRGRRRIILDDSYEQRLRLIHFLPSVTALQLTLERGVVSR